MIDRQVTSLEDPVVVREVEAYRQALEAGARPDRARLLQRFPGIAQDLEACIDGLDIVYRVAPHLRPEDPAPPELDPMVPLGDFRLLREVGRGGMGVVYEAEQVSLGRRVALKILPFAAVLDERCLQRFKNEAQAAAHLHHTHIVPVHSVGCERGVHYYAMQLIEGATVADLIAELRGPARDEGGSRETSSVLEAVTGPTGTQGDRFARAVAQLGIQAAEALDYAHGSGVVHRDVKPANLIVDGSGHLWITDFGLASTRNDVGLTMTGDLVGTVRYMSPEQTRARRMPIDHRTDVYSLGATLYELLTLRPAFPGDDLHEVMRDIATREPTRPSALRPSTPTDLETILLKTLAKDPAERYETARALADDLRRFLDGRPIQARSPTPWKRTAMWAHRHRTLVGAAAVVLVLAVGGLAASTMLIERQRRIAVDRAELAEREGARAEANFRTAREAVDSMTRQAQELAKYPDIGNLRQEMLEEALRYHLRFVESAADGSPAVRYDAALAEGRVGDIYLAMGRLDDAGQAWLEAIHRLEALLPDPPDAFRVRFDLATAHSRHGVVLFDQGHFEEASAAQEAALREVAKAEEVRDRHPPAGSPPPDGPRWSTAQLAADAHLERAGALRELRRHAAAEAAYRKALELSDDLLATHPDERQYRQSRLVLLSNFAEHLQERNEYKEAEELLRRHADIIDALASDHPSYDLRDARGLGRYALGGLYLATERHEQAEKTFLEAQREFEALVRDCPRAVPYRLHLGWACDALAQLHLTRGEFAKAETELLACRQVFGGLAADCPDNPMYRFWPGRCSLALARIHEGMGKREPAREACEEAVRVLDGLREDLAGNLNYRLSHTHAHARLAAILGSLAEPKAAESHLHQAVALQREVVRDFPKVPAARAALAAELWQLAMMHGSVGRNEPALDCLDEAIGIQRELVRASPDVARYRARLGDLLLTRAQARVVTKRYRRAVEDYEDAWKLHPQDVNRMQNLAWLLVSCPDAGVRDPVRGLSLAEDITSRFPDGPGGWQILGMARYWRGEWADCAEALERSLELRSAVPGYDWLFLAMASKQLNKPERARELYDKARAWILENRAEDAQLQHFRAEAAALLGLAD